MPRVEIWCKQDLGRGAKQLMVFEGDIPAVPRVGEYVIVFDGWASREVLAVHHPCYDEPIWIEIGPDYSGEYAEALAQRSEPAGGEE